MTLLLSIDGGGTKTLALLGNEAGAILARGLAGSSNLNSVGFAAACAALESAIRQALGAHSAPEVQAVVLGLAGAGQPTERQRFQAWAGQYFPQARVHVITDAELLLSAFPNQPALALIAGTGSIAFARAPGGNLIRAGGWGYLWGDEGSAFWVGAQALRIITQAHDGLTGPTALTALFLNALDLQTPPELIPCLYNHENPRAAIAALAPQVEIAAAQGDPAARRILHRAADSLAHLCLALSRRAGFPSPVPFVFTGGALLNGRLLQASFRRSCRRLALPVSEFVPLPEPAQAGLRLAMTCL